MTCDCGTDALVLVSGRTVSQWIVYDVTDDAGAPIDLTGKTVSAVATFDATGAVNPSAVISGSKVRIGFTAALITTIGNGKNVAINISIWNADDSLFDRVVDTAVTAY